ncbi:MAG: DNA modification methylase [Pseudomonadota bacterium]
MPKLHPVKTWSKKSNQLQIEMIPIDDFRYYHRRLRRHRQSKIRKLMRFIEEFGLILPILTDENGLVLAGLAVIEAARRLGYTVLPAVRITYLTEAQKRTLRIAHNKLAEGSEWIDEELAFEIKELHIANPELDLTITGLETVEIDNMLGFKVEGSEELNESIAPSAIEMPVSQKGDLFRIGPHFLLVGDAKNPADYALLMGGSSARMVLTDSPYNVPINGHVSGLGKTQHREFAEASGEMTSEEFIAFQSAYMAGCKPHLVDGALLFMFMDAKHLFELESAARQNDIDMKALCVWDKQSGGMSSLYRSQHELMFVGKFADHKAPHTNNIQLGAHGRYRTNIWSYPGVNSFGKGREEALAMHPTVKPVEMLADAILDVTKKSEIILDMFGGSGSTMVAAEHVGREARIMEIDPIYADTIIHRMDRTFGIEAVHQETGLAFSDLAEARLIENGEAANV